MKLVSILFGILFSACLLKAQPMPNDQTDYPQTRPISPLILKSEPMVHVGSPPGIVRKRVGQGLVPGGILFIAGGILMIHAGNREQHSQEPDDVGFGPYPLKQMAGAACFLNGVGMTVTGIVLWDLGANQNRQYRKNLRQVVFNFSGTHGGIAFRF